MGRREQPSNGTIRVLCVITAMGCGGAERRLADLVNLLIRRGHRVHLRVLQGGSSFFDVDDRVDLEFWERERQIAVTSVGRFSSRVRWLRDNMVVVRPDVVLSFIDVANTTTLMATRSLSLPVVVAERVHPPAHRIPLHFAILRRFLYPGATRIVLQTEAAARWARTWLPDERIVLIPNPVVAPVEGPADRGRGLLPPGGRWLVAMGRLERQKGFDVLISAFRAVAHDHPDWRLVILGEGPERPALAKETIRLGLESRVLLPGTTDTPEDVLRECDVFVLSSRYEGFPNALCEAMACGLPVVSTDCPAGPREIIRDGLDGILVPPNNSAALAQALSKVMSDRGFRRQLAARATEVVRRFDANRIFDAWETLLREVVTTARARE